MHLPRGAFWRLLNRIIKKPFLGGADTTVVNLCGEQASDFPSIRGPAVDAHRLLYDLSQLRLVAATSLGRRRFGVLGSLVLFLVVWLVGCFALLCDLFLCFCFQCLALKSKSF